MGLTVHFEVLNQLGTPMMHSATLANRPAAGIAGRIFFRTDSPFGIFRDTGSAWDQISGASTFSGSLATDQVAFGSATNTIAGSAGLTYSDSSGIFTLSKNQNSNTYLSVQNSTTGNAAAAGLYLSNNSGFGRAAIEHISTSKSTYKIFTGGDLTFYKAGVGDIAFLVDETAGKIKFSTGASSTASMTLAQTGNLLIGSTTDSGQRVQITGDTKVTGILEVGTLIKNITNIPLRIEGHVGVGNILNFAYFTGDGTQASGNHNIIYSGIIFRPVGGNAVFNQIQFSPTINQTGGATGITRGIWIAPTITSAADWRSFEWSNNSGWGIYGSGTALNYLGGSLGIKTTAPYSPSTFSLDVNGGLLVKNTAGTTAQITLINANPALGGNEGFIVNSVGGTSGSSYADLQGYYGTSITGSTAIRLNPAGGPVIINSTTNSGEQVQITGSLRVNGQLSPTMGTASGQHLIINCDGTLYKINLFNP
jgi:hypothetical protein